MLLYDSSPIYAPKRARQPHGNSKNKLSRKDAECAALIDTGSSLKEPFSSYPAIVFEYSAIASVLPDEIKELVRREIKEDEAYACRGVRL